MPPAGQRTSRVYVKRSTQYQNNLMESKMSGEQFIWPLTLHNARDKLPSEHTAVGAPDC